VAARLLDLAGHGLRRIRAAGVVDDDGEAVPAEPLGDRGADAARGAGDEREFSLKGLVHEGLQLDQSVN
jgi:hypothetical protein